jgi:hypothetical protein
VIEGMEGLVDFLLFQLLFAGVMLVLLIVLAFAVRSTLRQRGAGSGPRATRVSAGMKPRPFKSSPAPEPAAPVKTARKRQIGPAAARPAEESDIAPMPTPPETIVPVDDETAIAPDPIDVPAMPAAPEMSPPAQTVTFRDTVMTELEEAFDRYTRGEIALADYVALVRVQQNEVDGHIAELRRAEVSETADPALREERIDDALCARDAIQWCLEWAEGLSHDEPA